MDATSTWDGGIQPLPFHPNATSDAVEVWRDDRDLLWRWHYRGHDGTDLMGNRSYPSREAAVEAAEGAYPGVLIRHRPQPPARPSHRVRTVLIVLAVLLVVLTAGVGLLVAASFLGTAVALRARQRRRPDRSG